MKSRIKKRVVAVSGGFDPLHIGHVRYISEARKLGDRLVVILNNDHWLRAKKGFVFMEQHERAEVLRAISGVDEVYITHHKPDDPDRSVIKALEKIRPAIFANGGDRVGVHVTPEAAACERLGIHMVFGVGMGGKVQSSSWLTNKISRPVRIEVRPWGSMQTFVHEPGYWLKVLSVSPGKRLSLQAHEHRFERWVCVEGTVEARIGSRKQTLKVGDSVAFGPHMKHRLSSTSGGVIAEVAYGDKVDERDIVRFEDDYGRV